MLAYGHRTEAVREMETNDVHLFTRTSMAADDCVVGCQNVAKRFGHVEALRNANVIVPAGKVVALVGDNGAGKSTLMKTLLGINKPDRGDVIINNEPVRLHSI